MVYNQLFLPSVSETSGYSSGYESEAASSECLSVDDGSDAEKDAAQRRVRTKFTPEQINKLEKIFNQHKYLDAGERVKTAQKLNLTETQVKRETNNNANRMPCSLFVSFIIFCLETNCILAFS